MGFRFWLILLAVWLGSPAGQGLAASYLDENPDEFFAELYREFGITGLPVRVARDPQVWVTLEVLKRERCDRQALGDLVLLLDKAKYRRQAAEAQFGFVRKCKAPTQALYKAINTFIELADFPKAVEAADEYMRLEPANHNAHYLRGNALEGVGDYRRALSDYANAIELYAYDKHKIGHHVYARMANAYAKLGQYCEAATPILMWIAVDPMSRDNDRSRKIIGDFERQGNCGALKGDAKERYALRGQSHVVLAKADINGVRGTFIIDTGASYVAIKPKFAERAKIALANASEITISTANGLAKGKLAKADKVTLGKLEAANVPIVVQSLDKMDVDGLLGMSFLSRFEIQMAGGFLEIRTRKTK